VPLPLSLIVSFTADLSKAAQTSCGVAKGLSPRYKAMAPATAEVAMLVPLLNV
jgi:hypothetical protein